MPVEDIRIVPCSPEPDLSVYDRALRVIVQPHQVHRSGEMVTVVRLWLAGELTTRTVASLARVLTVLRKRGARRVALDAASLLDLDATGVAFLLQRADALRSDGGDLRVLNAAGRPAIILDVMGVNEALGPVGNTAQEQMLNLAFADAPVLV